MIQVHWVLNQYWTQKPWSDLVYTPLVIALSVVGFSYLLPLDVSFSMWFFLLFFRAQDYIASVMGYQPVNAALYPARYHIGYQSAGAFFVIVFSLMWMARPHFRDVWKRIKNPELDKDNGEMLSYRTAFLFAIIGMMGAICWCWHAGAGLMISIITIMVFAIIVIVLSRCVAEIGLILLQPIFRPVDVFAIGASPAVIGPAGLAVLSLVNGTFIRDPRALMPAMLDGMKAAGSIGLNRKSLGKAFLLAIPAAIIFSLVFQLNIIYETGGLSLNRWFFQDNPQMYFTEAKTWLVTKPSVNPAAGAWFSVGALTTIFLFVMRTQFWWWPFHPLGYAMGAAWPAIIFWFAFFCGWLSKALLLRYGGARAYVGARPFFLGLILGEFTIAIVWALLAGLFGMRAPSIPIS